MRAGHQLAATRDWACNLDMTPDQESNQQSFSAQNDAQSTKAHQIGQL